MLSHGDYEAFQKFLEDACGIVLGAGKEYLVSSRLGGLMREYGITTVGDLLNQLSSGRNQKLRTSIIDAMTTNETFWFRDMSHFRLLQDMICPEIKSRSGRSIRIWSAACSYGQEPYNLSMVVQDYQKANPGALTGGAEVIATDISSTVLTEAKKGIYCGMSASRGLSMDQQNRYFKANGDCLEVRPEIKQRVSFRELNLTKGYEMMGRFDVIFCRNVLIYFSSDQKRDIIARMARVLNHGGYLFLGSTESLTAHTDRFEMVSSMGGIAYRLK
jgi:chemotaxis protein methyltransferase CheR